MVCFFIGGLGDAVSGGVRALGATPGAGEDVASQRIKEPIEVTLALCAADVIKAVARRSANR
jgi:hypothetical protein